MTSSGYLSEKREKQIGLFLDAIIDFNELFPSEKKFLGIFKMGSLLEHNDLKIFTGVIHLLDDHLIAPFPEPDKIQAIEDIFILMEKRDIPGLLDRISAILAGEIDIPFVANEKQIFQGALMFFSGLIGKALEKAAMIMARAELENK